MRTAEHIVIGAGIAGLTLRRLLGPGCVLLDPAPGGYKIGESVIPEQFCGPPMAEALTAARGLASASSKAGVLFRSDDSVVAFPAGRHAERALHVMRADLEAMLMQRWGITVEKERVEEVDLRNRVVRTSKGQWRSRGPIIDCSGPAMVTASAAGTIEQLWPVAATWGYLDVDACDPTALAAEARRKGVRLSTLDVPDGRIVDADDIAFDPTAATILTRIRDGVWSWQIPLYDRRILSFGVVSRGGLVSDEEYLDAVRATVAPCWRATPRLQPVHALDTERFGAPLPPSTSVLFRRAGFARRCRVPASGDHVCLGDASQFADPVYSVGTGAAVAQARTLAARLSRGPWTQREADRWCEEQDAAWQRAVRAFGFWYDGTAMTDAAVAADVQRDYLLGGAFRGADFTAGATRSYGAMIGAAIDEALRDLRDDIGGALAAVLRHKAIGLQGVIVESRQADLQLSLFRGDERCVVRVNRDGPAVKAFTRAGGMAISYEGTSDSQDPAAGLLADAIDAVAGHAADNPELWRIWLARAELMR